MTLSTSKILELVMDAFKVRVPILMNSFATDFSSEQAKLNQTVIARITKLPSAQDYHASTGYKANAAESTALIEDVPVTINQHKHVPIKLDFLDAASTVESINLLDESTSNAGYVLGKSIVDYALGLVTSANFSESSAFPEANSDLDMLENVRTDLNSVGANTMGRFGIVNSGVMTALNSDARIASGDYFDQRIGGDSLGHLKNISGFGNIWEYPDMPANAENLTSLFGTKESLIVSTRLPNDIEKIAQSAGIPSIAKFDTLTDPDTGLTLLGIEWMEAGTFDLYCTVTVMYGAVAGSQGGSAGDKTDYAGHRVVTA